MEFQTGVWNGNYLSTACPFSHWNGIGSQPLTPRCFLAHFLLAIFWKVSDHLENLPALTSKNMSIFSLSWWSPWSLAQLPVAVPWNSSCLKNNAELSLHISSLILGSVAKCPHHQCCILYHSTSNNFNSDPMFSPAHRPTQCSHSFYLCFDFLLVMVALLCFLYLCSIWFQICISTSSSPMFLPCTSASVYKHKHISSHFLFPDPSIQKSVNIWPF